MEENKGLKVTPVTIAATDPAALPGLVPSPPDDVEEEDKDETTAADADEPEAETDEADAEADAESDEDADAAAEDSDDDDAADDTGTAAEAGDDDGPVFEAADRRGSVTVDRVGVRFKLDDTEAEFEWPEIGAVEYKTSRFGRRLVLSVHDSRGICPAEVEAPDKATLKEWTDGLESALDAYFDEASP